VLASFYSLSEGKEKIGALLKFKGIKELTSLSKESGEASKKLSEFTRRYHSSNYFSEILGISDNMKEVKRLAQQASKTDSNVLILGDSGTGKTFLARKIHETSKRSIKPFITINCTSIPRELIESELFGYERNAFTGASQSGKKGLIELGQGGTIFFDEIGDMSIDMQAKLLSFIQDKKFFRVGGNTEIRVDVRMIFATNKNLENEVKVKTFREDLFYRINVIPIQIKPLRERREDIPALVNEIFDKLKNNMGLQNKVLSEDAMNLLLVYDYPGNIREMENLIQRAISLSELNVVNAHNFMIREYTSPIKGETLKEILVQTEKKVIMDTLTKNKGNVKKTYMELGVGKTNFYKKVKKLEIDLDKYK
jgi:transcriptional regulator with PAS, ATPase and Fis domain